jgi:hypothetical protein
MAMKSDVKPIVLTADGPAFTGRTRVRAYAVQSTGASGSAVINTLVNSTQASASTTTGVYMTVQVGAGQTETLNLPEDGVLYKDGVGVTSLSNVTVTLFLDK